MTTSPTRTFLRLAMAVLLSASAAFAQAQAPARRAISARMQAQIDAVKQEVASRTPTQRKITWSLLYAAKEKATGAVAVAGAPKLRSRVSLETDGRVKVKIEAQVTPELLGAIHTLSGDVTSSFPKYGAVYATVPLTVLETIAARPEVTFIGLPPQMETNYETPLPGQKRLPQPQAPADTSVNDPEGDVAHGAATVRAQYGVMGNGLKIGVLSDSIDDAAGDYQNALLNGYVSAVTVVPGQAGSNTAEGEGLAMLEVVHRLAPGAQLYFATGDSSAEQMATNIGTLVSDGCNIIIDDISYLNESPFQADTISLAVQAASDAGVLYFSSAANNGNLDSMMSSCWEGDFKGDPSDPQYLDFEAGQADSPQDFNQVGSDSSSVPVYLFWSDPLLHAASSYFLYEYNGDEMVQAATDSTTNPQQSISQFGAGDYVVIEQAAGDARFLHLDIAAQHSTFTYATAGRVRGHNACLAANSFSVAATPAAAGTGNGAPTGPYPNLFSSADMVEQFSNDGPRRIFYNPDGSAITPGNLTSTGGKLLAKPDFTAADGVSTSVGASMGGGGLDPFFGTSCAAPHAGALAALALSYNPALSPAQIGAALRGGTVQISSPGAGDRDAGAGILLAPNIIQALSTPPSIITFSPANGPAGTIVTVTGINLNTAVAANLAGVPAAYAVTSANALTVTVPAGAGTGPITVLTAGGTAVTPGNFTITSSVSTPVVSSATTASGRVGNPFAYQITATNGPTSFAAAGLPGGLSVTGSGLIMGIPTVPGTFPVTLSAGNAAGGASSAVLTLTILSAPPAIVSAAVPAAQVGVAFGFQVAATNGPTGFSATGLPPGLIINAQTGLISGVPAAPGAFVVTVTASNAGGASSAAITLTVLPAVPVITSALSVAIKEGVPFVYGITATNIPTSFAAAGLPAGLTINPATGVISGKPGAFGTVVVTISAANAGGTGNGALALVIAPPTVSVKALIASVGASSHKAGEFVLTLSQAQTRPVTVEFTIAGTAADGKDYTLIKDSKVIKAGTTSQTIKVVPRDDFAGSKVVRLVLKNGPGYTIHPPENAKVKIVGNE